MIIDLWVESITSCQCVTQSKVILKLSKNGVVINIDGIPCRLECRLLVPEVKVRPGPGSGSTLSSRQTLKLQ